jgi:hypothetical protein
MKLENSRKIFTYYRQLGQTCLDRLSYEEMQYLPEVESNSVSVMVKHLWGNMLSRWTDFLKSDGEKEWRKRDEEFIDSYHSKQEIIDQYNEGWDCVFGTLNALTDDQLDQTVYIRNEGQSVSEALDRQLAHYAYHVGQIVFLAKLIKGKEWVSLSIPKNKSAEYNAQKFSEQKTNRHFTDEV